MQTYDYSNSEIKSLSRPMTDDERRALVKARKAWTPKARTPEQEATNDRLRTLIAALYEDGVARTELAAVTRWSVPSIAQKIRAAVAAGNATGRRVYRPIEKPEKEPAPPTSRHLTPKEAEWLRKNAARMPRTARGYYRWDHALGDKISSKIGEWSSEQPPVSQESIGEALGMSRQAVGVLLRRHVTDRPKHELTKPKGMTAEQFDQLTAAYLQARPWGSRRIRWASPASGPLIRTLGDLYLEGLSLDTLAQALDLEANSIRNGLTKSGVVLRVDDIPSEKETRTVLKTPSRTAAGRKVSKANPDFKQTKPKAASTRASKAPPARKKVSAAR